MTKTEKMMCPSCGAEMNHHADKIVYGSDLAHADAVARDFINEFHTCPECGANASRIV